MIDIQILESTLNTQEVIQAVSGVQCGALITFTGTVRDNTTGRKVLRLEYECYQAMALGQMTALAENALGQYNIQHISIHHRMGILIPGDIAVIIAVGSAHRADAFAACQYLIDTLKQTVPIWKKEVFTDGEVWVSAHS